MAYGSLKVDNIIFTNGGVDQTITVSGIVAATSGNLTVTGTISGAVVRGGTLVSGATVTGGAGQFTTLTGGTAGFTTVTGTTVTGTTANFVSGVFTTQISGATVTGNAGQFTNIAAGGIGATTITGTTVTGTTANFASGVFTTQISGATVTGTTANFTSGNFTSISGGTQTVTSGVFASGTAALPSISFASDPNTGIYSPGADQVAISTNGTQRLTVDTAATTSTLPVVHPLGAVGTPSITFTGDLNTGFWSPSADAIAASTGGSERLRIDSSGRLGLGTSSPVATSHIRGSGTSGQVTASWMLENFSSGTVGMDVTGSAGASIARFLYGLGPSTGTNTLTPAISIGVEGSAAGRVGIGTTSPVSTLTVNGIGAFGANSGSVDVSAARELYIRGASDSSLISFQTSSTSSNGFLVGQIADEARIQVVDAHPLTFHTSNAERARIDSSGRLLVGTSSASGSFLLQVDTTDATIYGVRVGRGAGAISTNTAVGNEALDDNTTGSANTANGYQSLYSNTTGNANTANGYWALYSNTTGGSNTANGYRALYSNTTGDSNTANGRDALYSNTTGGGNAANGYEALYSNTTGDNNTANGRLAGYGDGSQANTTGSNNAFIGNQAMGASSTASNVITLGNGSIATLRCQVTTITSLSDERDKKNIATLGAGLEFLNKLRPVSFTWDTRDKYKVDIEDTGFIAQELLATQTETGITIPNLVSQENPDRLEAGYGTLIPVLVNAVQELTAMVKQLQDEITTLKGDN